MVRLAVISALILASLTAAAKPRAAIGQWFPSDLSCRGEGTPIVIFDPGANRTAASWSKVSEPLSILTRVCLYDRTGAPLTSRRPTALSDAQAIHGLLAAKQEEPPFVLVGQSYGALIVRAYAGSFPQQVAGLVLVDSPHEDYANERAKLRHEPPPSYPPELSIIDWPTTFSELRSIKTLGEIPIIVLSSANNRDTSDASDLKLWLRLQTNLAKLSTRGIQRTVENVDYSIPIDAPDSVIRAVRQVVEAARHDGARPLLH
jgi:pimeloyl-ACP methyl ester carboxylesterase